MTGLTLNILGAGKVGRVLARLFCQSQDVQIGQVLNTSLASATEATEFIGQGTAVPDWSGLQPADAWMIASVDSSISLLADQLYQSGLVESGQLVFHLSGVLCADVFRKLQDQGVIAASAHLLKSFPDPDLAYRSFGQPFCALEGDDAACETLEPWLLGLGACPFRLAAEQKVLYHAANTMLCNYLLALLDTGLLCYEQAGIDPRQALEMVAPLMRETLENGLRAGPAEAMTGPLVRGDHDTVRAHLEQLPIGARDIYRSLGNHLLQMAESSDRLTADQVRSIREVFRNSSPLALD